MLVIDTSGIKCSVAIIIDQSNTFFAESELSNNHSEAIFNLIELVLAKSSYTYDMLNSISVVVGPGSFTGIRVGIAAAKGIKLVTNKPIFGITTLEIVAYSILPLTNGSIIHAAFPINNNYFCTQTFDHNIKSLSNIELTHIDNLSNDYKNNMMSININAKIAGLLAYRKLMHNFSFVPANPIYFSASNYLNNLNKIKSTS